jgi:hypothetical protein
MFAFISNSWIFILHVFGSIERVSQYIVDSNKLSACTERMRMKMRMMSGGLEVYSTGLGQVKSLFRNYQPYVCTTD